MGALDWALASPLCGLPLVGSETEEVRSAFKYILSFPLTEGGLLIEDAETQRIKKAFLRALCFLCALFFLS
jgi:hypothetical protein